VLPALALVEAWRSPVCLSYPEKQSLDTHLSHRVDRRVDQGRGHSELGEGFLISRKRSPDAFSWTRTTASSSSRRAGRTTNSTRAQYDLDGRAVDTVLERDQVGELELDESCGGPSRIDPCRAHELVGRERAVAKPAEKLLCGRANGRFLSHHRREAEHLEYVACTGHGDGSEAEQRVCPAGEGARDLSGHRENVSSFFEREVGGDERAASLPRLDDDGRLAEARDDPVAR
jgi:hypothetical protein